MKRPSISRMVVACIGLASLATSAALAATQRETAVQVVAQVDGTFSVYDYTSGTSTVSDVAAQWDAGTYASTEKTPDGSSIVLLRTGDVAPNPAHSWWNPLWRTRRCWTVTNSTAATLTNARATLTMDSTSDIAQAWMAAGGVDIRATTGGATPVPLLFNLTGPYPSVSSVVTVAVPSLAAAASETVCVYWGNPAAASASVVLPLSGGTPLYRLASNVTVTDSPMNWSSDAALPSGVTRVLSTGQTISVQSSPPALTSADFAASVPAATPAAIFTNLTLADSNAAGAFAEYQFSVPTGTAVEVRSFHADLMQNKHFFNATLNGLGFLPNNFSPSTTCLAQSKPNRCGVMNSATTTSVGGLVSLRFNRGTPGAAPSRRPIWSAIEVRSISAAPTALGVTAGDRREGLLPASGMWTSPVIDTASGSTVYGTVNALLLGTNLAAGKPVTATAVSPGSALQAGNDGRRTGTAFISNTVADPFWEVDLGSVQPIRNVDAYTTSWAMSNVTVFVSPTSLSSFASPAAAIAAGIPEVTFAGPVASSNMNSVFPAGTTGRYVRIWGAGAGLINLSEVEVSAPVPNNVTVQVASSASASGPWVFVGPDGTAGTSYVEVGAFPYSFDASRYYRVRARLESPAGISSPVVNEIRTNAGLTVLPRSADGFHQFKASEEGINWTVRIKTPLPNITSLATATLHSQNTSSWGTSQISGFLDRVATNCCAGNDPFFSTAGATTSQTPVPMVDVGGFRNLSVINLRADDIPANHDQIVDIQLAPLVRVQVPLRRSDSSLSTPANIALGKVASQSSTGFGGIAGRGNDNNTNGNYFGGSSVTHTNLETRPWWQVDLGSQRLVNYVEVHNRTDCCANRLNAFWIVISPTPLPATYSPAALSAPGVVYQTYTGGPFAAPQTLTFPGGAIGRYVRLWSHETNYLHIAEVRVIGPN